MDSKVLGVFLCVLFLSLAVVFSISYFEIGKEKAQTEAFANSSSESVPSVAVSEAVPPEVIPVDKPTREPLFTVRLFGKAVCVYTGDGLFLKRLSVNVDRLSESDRALLQSGIDLYSYEELLALEEDLDA